MKKGVGLGFPIGWPPLTFRRVSNGEVDTTLSLAIPGSSNKLSTSKSADDDHQVSKDSDDGIPSLVYNPAPPLRLFFPPRAHFNGLDSSARFKPDLNGGGGGDEEVDTTLSLSRPGSCSSIDKKSTRKGADDDQYQVSKDSDDGVPSLIFNPMPITWYIPQEAHLYGLDSSTSSNHDQNQVDTTLIAPKPLGNNVKKSRERGKRKIREDGGDQSQRKRKSPKSSNRGDDENQRPLIPIEEIQGLFETLLSREGTTPVFLYRKKLETSDVLRDQNRLFVNKREKLMEFLREEEQAAVVGDGKGLKVVGIDGRGNVYDKVGLKEWRSLKKMTINSQWSKVVAKNNAEKGDVVEIWGYREKEKACLAFNFRRERDGGGGGGGGGDGASGSGSTNVIA